jgi:hypothetical protein
LGSCFSNDISFVEGQSTYTIYRSASDGTSDGVFSYLDGAIDCITNNNYIRFSLAVSNIWNIINRIQNKLLTLELIQTSNQITGCTRGANSTTAATHTDNTAVYDYNSITYGPDDIYEASYRNTQQVPVVDFPLTKISRSVYNSLSSKYSQGQSTQYWVQRFIDKITITLYLTPGSDQVNNVMHYYYAKRIQDVGAYTNITNVPYRFVPCMCAGLAYYLAVKFAPQRGQEMKLLYEDELLRALDNDGSSSSSFITPKTYYPSA